jgi:diguanylate cyclase (GGDEF)-like protein/PAS domain S-box-containing protein
VAQLDVATSLTRLLRVSADVAENRGLDDLLAVLLRSAVDLPGVDTVRILLADPDARTLTPEAGIGFEDGDSAGTDRHHGNVETEPETVPFGIGFAGRVAETRTMLRIVDSDDCPQHGPALRRAGVRSAVGVPLIVGERLVGVLHIGSKRAAAFDATTEEALKPLADRVALTVEAIVAERALAVSERRFRALFEQAPIGVVLTDLRVPNRGRVILANHAMSQLTGFPQDQLLGMHYGDLLVPEEQQAAHEAVESLATGRTGGYVAERQALRADGTRCWIRSSVSAGFEGGAATYAIAYVEDVTARRSTDAALARKALTDPLTGLANRSLVMDHLRLALRGQARSGSQVGLLYVDLDNFKDINDEYGHEVGDRALREVAQRLGGVVRDSDTAGRIGGDEFVVVCPELTGSAELITIATRIIDSLGPTVSLGEGRTQAVTASVGAALSHGLLAPEDLLRRADIAMYEAKRQGRRRWVLYTADLEAPVRSRRDAESVLGAALEHGWLRLYYQPIVDLVDHRTVGVEALLRIEHPEHGLILPATFVDVLEGSELAEPIERWVLDEACRQRARWHSGVLGELAVNVSGRLAASGRLCAAVVDSARRAGIDPATLVIEMTEGVLVQSDPAVLTDLESLTHHGVSIAIDDFGTGYASLTYLQRFPASTIKVDRSFVAGIGQNPRDDAIVAAVSALGASLRMTVIAEGVEDQSQAERARRLGCHRAQGFLYGRPVRPEELLL